MKFLKIWSPERISSISGGARPVLGGPTGNEWYLQFMEFSQTLLTLIQQYRWEIDEIKSSQFIQIVNEWKDDLKAAETSQTIDVLRRKLYAEAADYLKKEKNYLVEREVELKNLIELLSDAVSAFTGGNERYHDRITKTAQNVSKISQLEDIRKIRSLLTTEVQQLKETVKQKQRQEQQEFQKLSQYASALQSKLQSAVNRSMQDGLTGLYNREGWDQEITDACRTASVTQQTFAVALVDIDNFKQINDDSGHQVGDLVLAKLGKILRESFRSDDFIARFGGDEFALLLVTPSLEKAKRRLDRLCREIANPSYHCPVDGKDYYVRMSISCGLGFYREGDSPETLFRRADEALYAAKKSGRNQVATEAA